MTQAPSIPSGDTYSRRLPPHRGAVILVLGIISLVLCSLCGIFAWVMGNRDLSEMQSGQMDPSGQGLTQAGRVLGIIGACLLVIQCLVGVVYALMAIGLIAGAAGGAVR